MTHPTFPAQDRGEAAAPAGSRRRCDAPPGSRRRSGGRTSPLALCLILVGALAGCGPGGPGLVFVGISVGDSAHFEVATSQERDIASLTARFVWRDAAGEVVADRRVELTPDSGGYHRVVSPANAPDLVVRALPPGATQVDGELESLRYVDGGEWRPGA